MSFKETIEKSYITLTLFFATIIIIPIQTALLIPFSVQALSALRDEPLILFQNSLIILIGYILLPIIYCITISLLFKPKRIVSPMNIQIGTYVLFSIIFIYSYLEHSMTELEFEGVFFSLFIIFIFIMSIAFIQFFFVRWVIGLNLDETDRKSFLINAPSKDIIKILGNEFLFSRPFIKQKECQTTDKPIWILRHRDNLNNYAIIAFGSQKDDENKCILATVAFHMGMSWVAKSDKASAICESIVNDINIRLKKTNNKITIIPLKKIDDIVSVMAFSFVDSATCSKIYIIRGFFRSISRFFRRAIIATIGAFTILTGACYFGYLSSDNYVAVIIPTLIVLIIEFGIPLREELQRKKTEWFED